jgi:hypothetical protein
MRHKYIVLAVLLLSAATGACRDFTAPDAAALVPTPAVRALAQHHGASWEVPGQDPYACFVSTRMPSGPMAYRYDRVQLRLPEKMKSPTGAVTAYSYRLKRPNGMILQVFNCVVPSTAGAIEHLHDRLRVREQNLTPESEAALETTCVATSQSVTYQGSSCTIEGLAAVGEPAPPTVDEKPECTINGCDGGGSIPGGDGGGSPSGGSESCTDCGPETPVLHCTPVTREQITTCTLASGLTLVPAVQWKFAGGGHTISGPASASSWSGPAVLSGHVTASPASNPNTTLTATLTVNPRPWRWGTAQWSYSQGTAAVCFNHILSWQMAILGWNIPHDATCGPNAAPTVSLSRLQPDPAQNDNGHLITRVGFGPNNTLMYVDTVTYRMDRRSAMNPEAFSTGTPLTLTGSQASACGASANWYNFNRCMGVNVNALHAGVWNHEGFGSNGRNGHEGAARYAAANLANDPYVGAEPLVSGPGESITDFRDRMRRIVLDRAANINSYASDASGNVTGNWSGSVYLWDWSANKFDSLQVSI